ncbi:hypothetical protein V6N13_013039 [Hibiscus sabdariffa]|uniref:Uncharacterized protein n=1 Tax=Hibiscus sabdariffa TaxID=183260 RepID=A0ABR2SGZ3_9ROSI
MASNSRLALSYVMIQSILPITEGFLEVVHKDIARRIGSSTSVLDITALMLIMNNKFIAQLVGYKDIGRLTTMLYW